MAVAIDRNLDVLVEHCQQLNLTPSPSKTNKKGIALSPFDLPGKTVSKEDCVRTLQDHFINIYKQEGRYTQALDWILQTDFQPMLANQLKQCKWQDQIYTRDNEVIAEEKIDGNRSVWCLFPNEKIEIYSRGLSVSDYLPINYTNNIVITPDYSKIRSTFVIDGEIVASRMPDSDALADYGLQVDTTQLNLTTAMINGDDPKYQEFQKLYPLKLVVFDILMYNGRDLTGCSQRERIGILNVVCKELHDAGILIERPQNNHDEGLSVEDFHKKMLVTGKEGTIVKLLDAPYDMTGRRTHDAWIKIKRSIKDDMVNAGLGDTFDGFITGFKAKAAKESSINSWRIAAVEFSINVIDDDPFSDTFEQILNTQPIAYIGALTEEFAKEISEPDPENPGFCKLKKEAYGLVGEISGQNIAHDSQTLMHPVLVRMRNDKPTNQCTINKSFLENLLLERKELR